MRSPALLRDFRRDIRHALRLVSRRPAIMLLFVLTLVASWLPARRAARLDLANILREDA